MLREDKKAITAPPEATCSRQVDKIGSGCWAIDSSTLRLKRSEIYVETLQMFFGFLICRNCEGTKSILWHYEFRVAKRHIGSHQSYISPPHEAQVDAKWGVSVNTLNIGPVECVAGSEAISDSTERHCPFL